MIGPKMTFWNYLKQQKKREGPVGDLARDAIADRCHKRSSYDWWVQHLKREDACDGAFEALHKAWDEYKEKIHDEDEPEGDQGI